MKRGRKGEGRRQVGSRENREAGQKEGRIEGRGGGGRKRREREKMSKDGGGKVGKETGRK